VFPSFPTSNICTCLCTLFVSLGFYVTLDLWVFLGLAPFWTLGSSWASAPSRTLGSSWALCPLGPSGHSGPLRHISDFRVSLGLCAILGLAPLWTLRSSCASVPSQTLGSSWALRHFGPSGHLGPLRHLSPSGLVGLPCQLVPPYHLEPSSHLRSSPGHLGPSGHPRSLRHLRSSDSPQLDALSRRWDVYPKGGITDGTAENLTHILLSLSAPPMASS
jgi:hypothetical protein